MRSVKTNLWGEGRGGEEGVTHTEVKGGRTRKTEQREKLRQKHTPGTQVKTPGFSMEVYCSLFFCYKIMVIVGRLKKKLRLKTILIKKMCCLKSLFNSRPEIHYAFFFSSKVHYVSFLHLGTLMPLLLVLWSWNASDYTV